MLERSRARRQALQILYQREITGATVESILAECTYCAEDGEPDEYCREIALNVEREIERIDSIIGEVSENWSVSRMPLVDRNILRAATYELLHHHDVPPSVAINEAVELAKVYGGEDSSKFVNGVLGKIAARTAAAEETSEETDDGR